MLNSRVRRMHAAGAALFAISAACPSFAAGSANDSRGPPPATAKAQPGNSATRHDATLQFADGDRKTRDQADTHQYTPAILGLAGVLSGALIAALASFLTQNRLLRHQRLLADAAARLQIRSAFAQWQLQQISELYGPLHALFRQSHVLYRHMNGVLERADPNRFRLREDPHTDRFDERVFEINLVGKWERFRTVLHLGEVYGRGYGVEDYFDEIASIGKQTVAVIREKAGYARSDQADLVTLFGQYLAHYSVLSQITHHYRSQFDAMRGSGRFESKASPLPAPPMHVDSSAVFPGKIQGAIDAGLRTIGADLDRWREV